MLSQKIKEITKQYAPLLTGIRQHLHAHPELSFKEFETSRYIGQQLNDWAFLIKQLQALVSWR